jgi:phosphomannomutase
MKSALLQEKITLLTSSPRLENNYFELVKEIIQHREKYAKDSREYRQLNISLSQVYAYIESEIKTSKERPFATVKFGTSGWRGIIGKDITCHSVQIVTLAILKMYEDLAQSQCLAPDLGVHSLREAQEQGVVLGHDNRFGGELFAETVCNTLTSHGFTVYFAGEATTGTLSAAVLRLQAAFSINLTPSHNPLEYAGFKFNASDGGPASAPVTEQITSNCHALLIENKSHTFSGNGDLVRPCDSLRLWNDLVQQNRNIHGIDPQAILERLSQRRDFFLAVDCVHGASRVHMDQLLAGLRRDQFMLLRSTADVTFGGVAPEPSSENLRGLTEILGQRQERLKLGVIFDPDGDRIRFTDGITEINMNYFGPMAYHFLHEKHHMQGLVAKSVATSNLANKLAQDFNEEVFEPRVGFKEFKPVVNSALVCFEESDGITIIGHTPEKDGYIGLFLALAMTEETGLSLGEYYRQITAQYGAFFPAKDSVTVSEKGEPLLQKLATLERYKKGHVLNVGGRDKQITAAITIDGIKLVFADQSWLLIRPSGTEPKVRFYVESRTEEGKDELFAAAKWLLGDIGLL